jgi:uncharacterized protein YdhG (YjbR/CyaY superfamily)
MVWNTLRMAELCQMLLALCHWRLLSTQVVVVSTFGSGTPASTDRLARARAAGHNGPMDDAVQGYIEAIDPRHRPLFERVHGLILAAYPEATVVLSYKMPTYRVGARRLHLGVWNHGVSLYGWPQGRDAGFTARHPALRTSKGTIRLQPEDAAGISDAQLTALIRAAPEPAP